MYNVVIAGNCYDNNQVPINLNYNIYYYYKDVLSDEQISNVEQLTANSNELTNLGYDGYLDINEPIYIDAWDNVLGKDNSIFKGYMRFDYTGSSTMVNDIVLHNDLVLEYTPTVDVVDNTRTFTPLHSSNLNFLNTRYYVYYKTNELTDITIVDEYKLIDVITDVLFKTLIINFLIGGNYKIVSEIMVETNQVSEQNIVEFNITSCEETESSVRYIEWE